MIMPRKKSSNETYWFFVGNTRISSVYNSYNIYYIPLFPTKNQQEVRTVMVEPRLVWAADAGKVEVVESLLAAGVDVNVKGRRLGCRCWNSLLS